MRTILRVTTIDLHGNQESIESGKEVLQNAGSFFRVDGESFKGDVTITE